MSGTRIAYGCTPWISARMHASVQLHTSMIGRVIASGVTSCSAVAPPTAVHAARRRQTGLPAVAAPTSTSASAGYARYAASYQRGLFAGDSTMTPSAALADRATAIHRQAERAGA